MKLDNIPEVRISGLLADLAGLAATNGLTPVTMTDARLKRLQKYLEWAIEREAQRKSLHRADRHGLHLRWVRSAGNVYAVQRVWSYAGEVGGLRLDGPAQDFARAATRFGISFHHGYHGQIIFGWKLD